MNLKQIKEEVAKLNNGVNYGEAFKAGVVLLSSVEVGVDENKLVSFCKLKKEFVHKVFKNLSINGVFKDGKIYHSGWDNKKSGGMAFWLDVSCGLGYIRRINK